MKTRLLTLMVAGFVISFGSLPLQADLITNGSFETVSGAPVPAGGFNNYLAGSTAITGWTVVGPEVSVVSGTYAPPPVTFPAEDGSQWLDLTGFLSNTIEGVEQTVATTPGTSYTLAFWVGNVDNPGVGAGVTSTVEVRLGGISGSLIDTATNSSTNPNQLVWQKFTTSFTATGLTTALDFINGDPSNDNSNGLDNVSLTASGPATVPEPSTLSLLGVSLACLGFFLCRREIVQQIRSRKLFHTL